MRKQPGLMGAVLALCLAGAAPAFGVECAAARAMADGEKDLEARKEAIQRPEWLLLEFLVSDKSKKSQKLFAEEVEKSARRGQEMTSLFAELQALPADTPPVPEDGTPACETITRAKASIDKLLADRDAEIKKFIHGDYKFIWGCDQIGMQLTNLGTKLNQPDSKVSAKTMALTVPIVMGPQSMAARMSPDELDRLTAEMFQPSTLPGRTRHAYGALHCLRNYQRIEFKPLAAVSEVLAKCETSQWQALGACVNEATLTPKK
jgi:hypothetical protein